VYCGSVMEGETGWAISSGVEARLALLKARRAPGSQVPPKGACFGRSSSSSSHADGRPARPVVPPVLRTASADSPGRKREGTCGASAALRMQVPARRPSGDPPAAAGARPPIRLRAPGRVNNRQDSGGTGRVAAVVGDGSTPHGCPAAAASPPSSCSSPDVDEQPAQPPPRTGRAEAIAAASASPSGTGHRGWEAVEGISPATRRYGGIASGARPTHGGISWFPTELESPFPAGDKRGRLSINLCYSKSSKAVLTLLANAMGWASRDDKTAPASIFWAVAPEEVEEMLVLHKPNQARVQMSNTVPPHEHRMLVHALSLVGCRCVEGGGRGRVRRGRLTGRHTNTQRVGRLPGMHDLCRKVPFANIMQHFAARSPEVK